MVDVTCCGIDYGRCSLFLMIDADVTAGTAKDRCLTCYGMFLVESDVTEADDDYVS